MSRALSSLLVLFCAVFAAGQVTGGDILGRDQTSQSDIYTLTGDCNDLLNQQIGLELYASQVYLNMAGWFNKPSVSRFGYGKFFKDQSMEEYTHATKFVDYINKRNGTVKPISVEPSSKDWWDSPKDALKDALKLEKHVYSKIQYLYNVADQKCQDTHLGDFLTDYFFKEQVESIAEIQAMISKIEQQDEGAGQVITYLEDMKLLNGKIEL